MLEVLGKIFSITLIDLVLSGDNAAVVGLAIRNLPENLRKKAAIFGAGGAVCLQVTFATMATYLMTVNYLSAIGGLILVFITYKLIKPGKEEEAEVKASDKFWAAVGTIVVADISMAFDNVMGVAGVAEGHVLYIIFGLSVSIPILIFGATWLARLMDKFPIIIYLGATVLAHTATSMIVHDKALHVVRIVGETFATLIPWILAIPVLVYGVIVVRKAKVATLEGAGK
ncbi:TerC family protein [Candidatus Formimonas warabiya]|uniref:Uncharacterized protein n=1 Tax=Formimonas warabiya TaxID=1761012 RepID=A0A3G1L193_FORW1|nr:TerC family protein [Candidatus Formimonas warabiya]ATW28255.1 hypothetical protein DCMF_28970 [Candidatus Formimonas warabiya]